MLVDLDLVLEGGGTKIPALVGAVNALQSAGFNIRKVAGSSAGAIVSALIAAGYSGDDLRRTLFDIDFSKLLDRNWFGGKTTNLLLKFGVHSGDGLHNLMKQLLADKNKVFYGDLGLTEDFPPLRVLAADLTYADVAIFPDYSSFYGAHPLDMEIAITVRASASIPLFFEPVNLNGRLLVDGGVVSNFPIWIWDRIEPRYPTFGILLKEGDMHKQASINSLVQYSSALIKTVLQGREKTMIMPGDFKYRIIPVDVGNAKTLDWSMTYEEKLNLYEAGETAVKKFLETWSWDEYLSYRKNNQSTEHESRMDKLLKRNV